MEGIISTLGLLGALTLTFNPEAKVLPTKIEKQIIKSAPALSSQKIWIRDADVGPVLRDNIILQLHYIKGDVLEFAKEGVVTSPNDLDWEALRKPFSGYFILNEGETYAFQPDILPEFQTGKVIATPAKFGWNDGFKSYGGLSGNGVCYLASFMNWVGKGAGLSVTAKVNHDFYPVPGVPREYGTAIYVLPGSSIGKDQNLYITNNLGRPVALFYAFDGEQIEMKVF
jgi:hypothetical protein